MEVGFRIRVKKLGALTHHCATVFTQQKPLDYSSLRLSKRGHSMYAPGPTMGHLLLCAAKEIYLPKATTHGLNADLAALHQQERISGERGL